MHKGTLVKKCKNFEVKLKFCQTNHDNEHEVKVKQQVKKDEKATNYSVFFAIMKQTL